MKIIFPILILSIVISSCNQEVKVNKDFCTKLTTNALAIDPSKYKFLEDTFNVNNIFPPDFLGGLGKKYKLVVAYSIDKDSNYIGDPSVTNNFKKIIAEIENRYILIDSKEKFKELFSPVDSKEKALSFACALTNSIPRYEFKDIKNNFQVFLKETNVTYVKEVKNGYEVLLFLYMETGCYPHMNYSIKYFVNKDGDVNEIERKEFYLDPNDKACRD